ncbi:ABC transporter substrate-binding protein [Arhodomonas sp. KWT2]|uniref:ABC transporter substrate-binding protein n=1 Tax=Arhodomonas sp. KWT2 TaxID=3344194 RepID=UPI0035C1E022
MSSKTRVRQWTALAAATVFSVSGAIGVAQAQSKTYQERVDIARKWVENEFQPSTLSVEEQMEEMKWFIKASKPYRGMDIKVVSETISTHKYESNVMAKAFSEITGINITHDLIAEGDVIQNLQTEMQSGRSIYDAYVNDSDLIGTHFRYGDVVPLSDYMEGEGKDVTLPTLDVDDFIGRDFVTAPNGKMYQLPDQQFANLYWFRYDWFQKPELRKRFKERYGYDLGVPVNWSAYQDIAEFFTKYVKEVDGKKVYGHMDYGKKSPSLGWRFTDAWLSMAGAGDKGLPNGKPVDEWGIRVEDCHPVGSLMSRGGAVNSPASVYALEKYIDWLKAYAPPEASGMTFSEAGPVPAEGHVAQQIFWYTGFTAPMADPSKPVVNDDGTPKWRMAPSPHGPYWEEGMKLGYQDVGSWTLLKHTDAKRRKAAWLYAQFTTAKSTSLKKAHEGLTFIRDSNINDESFTERAPKLGGLVEFYRSPARVRWTPTGTNVPDYPKLASLWWQAVADAVTGAKTPKAALTSLGEEQDRVMARIERAGIQDTCAPRMNDERDPQYWLDQPGAPKPALSNEKPQGKTVPYDQLVKSWQEEG